MGPSNDIQLVLPARKEIIDNIAFKDLTRACELAIFRAIRQLGEHTLSFKSWQRAYDLGIELTEAAKVLTFWSPKEANDFCSSHETHAVDYRQAILLENTEPHFDQAIARAVEGSTLSGRFAEAIPEFEGYAWYDELPRARNIHFLVTVGRKIYSIAKDIITPVPIGSGHMKARKITVEIDVVKDRQIEHFTIPTLPSTPLAAPGKASTEIRCSSSRTNVFASMT
jgi:hypothetical protein